MSGGKITGNSGSGVTINGNITFTMDDGEISGNTSSSFRGGGVRVCSGTFTMNDGKISDNIADSRNGGGVSVDGGTFTMKDGEISGNTATGQHGGGVYVYEGTFTMSGGKISGNTASGNTSGGGGVSMYAGGRFTKESGGTIYGSDADAKLKNTAGGGNSYGHAVYVGSSSAKKRNTTAGEGVTLDSTKDGTAGGWE